MNGALGFDTFLALRHGVRCTENSMEVDENAGSSTSSQLLSSSVKGRDLGCYYCNDVVAPGDVSSCRM